MEFDIDIGRLSMITFMVGFSSVPFAMLEFCSIIAYIIPKEVESYCYYSQSTYINRINNSLLSNASRIPFRKYEYIDTHSC